MTSERDETCLKKQTACLKTTELSQTQQVVLPQIFQGIYIVIIGKIGNHENVIVRNVALFHAQLHVCIRVFLIQPSETQVMKFNLSNNFSLSCFMMRIKFTPSEIQ